MALVFSKYLRIFSWMSSGICRFAIAVFALSNYSWNSVSRLLSYSSRTAKIPKMFALTIAEINMIIAIEASSNLVLGAISTNAKEMTEW